ncbi:MAG: M48 family metallopeptidase [Hyphomonadaceae bacterium]|nr:M48 family metallopeptidase [Hyphomonadaceae bacterium]
MSLVPLNRVSRRRLLEVLAAGAVLAPLGACSENAATGRRQFVLVSDEMLEQLSQQAWAELMTQTPRVSDSGVQRRLEAIGQRVADASGLQNVNWEFVAFDSPEVNAFVLPGGKVGFFKGLIDLAESDGEIAAVMGHEVGHVAARHAAERLSQQLAVSVGVQAASILLEEEMGQHADEAAAALGMGLMYGVILPYSRAHELEADRLGVDVMSRAGYQGRDAVSFWRRMMEAIGAQGEPLPWLSTHPATEERLRVLEELTSA